MSSIHLGLLDNPRQQTFIKLKVFASLGVLSGGTALALQINHRHSYDFDIFLAHPIDSNHKDLLKQSVGISKTELDSPDQLTIVSDLGVNITLLHYPFTSLNKPLATDSLPLASLEDIAADKAYTIGRRAVWRDYVDTYFLLDQQIVTLDTIISLSKTKFSSAFNPKLFLEQLVYFSDVPVTPISFIGPEIGSDQIQSTLITDVKAFRKQHLP